MAIFSHSAYKLRVSRHSAVPLVAAALAACSPNEPPTAGGRRVSYTCDRGPAITVIYGGDVARIEGADGQTILLQRKETGSGFLFESATHSLRGQGNEVMYTIGRMVPMKCTTG